MKKIGFLIIISLWLNTLVGLQYGQNKIQGKSISWYHIQTKHFDIYFKKGEDEFGKIITLIAEEAYYYLKTDLKSILNERIPIIVYDSHQAFQTTNIIYPLLSEGTGGFTESLKNRVVVPFDGSYKKFEEVLVHELTHAYINDLNYFNKTSRLLSISNFGLPFWFSEGFPEFMAVRCTDNYNNLFITDMVLNDYLYPIDNMGGYYAYRMGESFLTYIEEKYGRETLIKYFYALQSAPDLESATDKTFGIKFKDLESHWKNYLKRKYYPVFSAFQVPSENSQQITKHKDDGSYLNTSPRFSPDGSKILYFSNKGITTSIWLTSTFGITKPRKILTGEKTGSFEEFHFMKSNLSWFNDNNRFAFVAKTSFNDVIYVYNIDKDEIESSYPCSDLDAVYEIDVSHDNKSIVLAGQKDMKTDLYILDLENKSFTRIMEDRYSDSQPKWSPDDTKILFTSDRTRKNNPELKHVFSSLTSNIFYYDLKSRDYYQVTADSFQNYMPGWSSDGTKITFISESKKLPNLEIIDLKENTRKILSKELCGLIDGEISKNNEYLVYTTFFDNGFDIFLQTNPIQNLDTIPFSGITKVPFPDDFSTSFRIDDYAVFGYNDKTGLEKPSMFKKDYFTYLDSLNTLKKTIDEKPNKVVTAPKIEPYKLKFYVDQIWGGMAYSSTYGTIGQLQLGLSDLMGNHGIGINLGITGKLKNSNIAVSYLYLAQRTDFGVGVFNLNDETFYEILGDPVSNAYYRNSETETGLYGLVRYPFNRFWRLDFENYLYKYSSKWSYTNANLEGWIDDYGDTKENSHDDFVYTPMLSLVHDNALYGNTGPMSGWKGITAAKKSIAKTDDFISSYTDLRGYLFFNKRYALASRLILGLSDGKKPEKFGLTGFSGVRGYDEDVEGRKKVLTSLELRFPFVDNLSFAFPLPLAFYQIRGSAFVDLGCLWDKNDNFRGSKDGILQDVKMGFGTGPRFDLGYFTLKFDLAWTTNLHKCSKPSYYLSLSDDY